MTQKPEQDPEVELVWRTYLMTGGFPKHLRQDWFEWKVWRPLVRLLPKSPRCRICYYPFKGAGGSLSKLLFGIEPSKMNPQLCNVCERFATKFQGGTEIEVSMLFADVRGSTGMAEEISPVDFSQQINRFYRATTEVLFRHNALVEKLIGDEVVGFFVPGFAGPEHAGIAVEAGRQILKTTGHGAPSGPWIPVGVGVHTGMAYIGSANAAGGMSDISLFGDAVNTTARLTSLASIGEMIISETTRSKAGLQPEGMEARHLHLKGRKQAVDAWVILV